MNLRNIYLILFVVAFTHLEVLKAENFNFELGRYQNRIDGGEYTGQGNYLIINSTIGMIDAEIEYVDTLFYQLYSEFSMDIDTIFGNTTGSILITANQGQETFIELGFSYYTIINNIGLNFDLSIEEGGQYASDISLGYELFSNSKLSLNTGIIYGKTFEYNQDYDYRLGFLRINTIGDIEVFAQINYLNNSITDNGYEITKDFGISRIF